MANKNGLKRNNYNEVFPDKLRKLMDPIKHPEWSRTKLAEHLGVSQQAVSFYLDGSNYPSLEKLEKIADYFNVSVDYLLGRTEVESPDLSIQAACEYTGLSEETVKKLHGIHEQLEASKKAKCSVKEITDDDDDDHLLAVMKVTKQELSASSYIYSVCRLECCICFIDALINSDSLEIISHYSGVNDIAKMTGIFSIINSLPVAERQMLEYGRQHLCLEEINKVIQEVKAKGRDAAFPYLTRLEEKLSKAEEKYNNEHPGNRQKII